MIAVASVASIAALVAVAYLSARIGYGADLADAPGILKGPDASFTVAVLDRIQAGDTPSAVALLQADLDSRLLDRWVYDWRGH
ncbi:MAG TPA: hypothetical protein VNZ53_50495 [Steroidobacteraceae bacterium]|nr:hypothetical protein [Steroidobacteraceae bacterium]